MDEFGWMETQPSVAICDTIIIITILIAVQFSRPLFYSNNVFYMCIVRIGWIYNIVSVGRIYLLLLLVRKIGFDCKSLCLRVHGRLDSATNIRTHTTHTHTYRYLYNLCMNQELKCREMHLWTIFWCISNDNEGVCSKVLLFVWPTDCCIENEAFVRMGFHLDTHRDSRANFVLFFFFNFVRIFDLFVRSLALHFLFAWDFLEFAQSWNCNFGFVGFSCNCKKKINDWFW